MNENDVLFNKLLDWFSKNGSSAIVALSGGVDSAVVALAAKKALGENAVAITADYKTQAEEELDTARKVAKEIGIQHRIIEYDELEDRKSTRLNSSHVKISYAVFCLKKKKTKKR